MKLNDVESCWVECLLILFTLVNGEVVLELEENNEEVEDVDGCLIRLEIGVISTGADLFVRDSLIAVWCEEDVVVVVGVEGEDVSRLTKHQSTVHHPPKNNGKSSSSSREREVFSTSSSIYLMKVEKNTEIH